MNTTILTHSDADGICAGALALSRFPNSNIFFTKPVSFYDDLKQIESDRIVICDIALTKKDAKDIVKLFETKKSIIYFDHHIIPSSIEKGEIKSLITYIHDERVSTSELIYRYYQSRIPRERVWVAIYGAIADYCDETPFITKRMKNWDRRAMYFEVSTLVLGIKNEKFNNYDAKRNIVTILSKGGNPSDVPGLVKSAKEAVKMEFELYELVKSHSSSFGEIAYVKDIHTFGFRGPAALFSATVKNKKVGLSIYTRKKYLDVTVRGRDNIPLNTLTEYSADAVGGSGGGHPSASGAKIPLGSLNRFLEEMNKFLKMFK